MCTSSRSLLHSLMLFILVQSPMASPYRDTAAANGSFGSSPTGQRLMVATASVAGHQGTTYFQGQLSINGGDKLGTSRGQAGALLGIVCQLVSLSSCGLQDLIW